MAPIPHHHPLWRYFSGLVEDAFCAHVGLCDPVLTDYLAELLVSFTHIDRMQMLRNVQGKSLEQVASMLTVLFDERPISPVQRDCIVYRHIGDYVLFWAGLYPEQLHRLHCDSPDLLPTYVVQGKRSYATVAELSADNAEPPAMLFRNLSEDFESCVYGLGLVRRDLEVRETTGPAGGLVL
ncbi:MAG TPA: hypothetical protein PKK06_17860 [Phycisphaerae bacterium]|nr:hypothetical protein [Phycisphaerae bacterium]HNU47098.1 hypothetical protein [Phycisphaerae bacterium]